MNRMLAPPRNVLKAASRTDHDRNALDVAEIQEPSTK